MFKDIDEGFEPDLSNRILLPQASKANYYTDRRITFSELSTNPQFTAEIRNLMNCAEKSRVNQKQKKINAQSIVQISEDEEIAIEEFSNSLNNLSKAVEDGVIANNKLVGSIIALRETYFKLTQIQKHEFIMDNSFINVELIELEEKLLEVGLITPSDIIDQSYFNDDAKKLEVASKIYRNILVDTKSQVFDPIFYQSIDQTTKLIINN